MHLSDDRKRDPDETDADTKIMITEAMIRHFQFRIDTFEMVHNMPDECGKPGFRKVPFFILPGSKKDIPAHIRSILQNAPAQSSGFCRIHVR